jgi:hypothetical protein
MFVYLKNGRDMPGCALVKSTLPAQGLALTALKMPQGGYQNSRSCMLLE